tara:strand:- start:5213 stop:5980 length:768 start_codon:yes stop_codon:yes gene_type:complete
MRGCVQMARLNEIIAIENGVKSRVYARISALHKISQKSDWFSGFIKTYEKINDEGEELPPERKKVQHVVNASFEEIEANLSEMFQTTARKDWTNCVAKADIEVNGVVILKDVPVTYLLFLEKQLLDIKTLVANLPTLDDNETWTLDTNSNLYSAEAIKTPRTKKLQKAIVLMPATMRHAAQTQLITEDVVVGYWSQIKQSGALPNSFKQAMSERVERLLLAVKQSRAKANLQEEIPAPEIGRTLFDFIWNRNVKT